MNIPICGGLDINKQYIIPSTIGTAGQSLYVPTSGRILEWKTREPSDWNATNGETQILNKPILTSVLVEDSILDLQLSPTGVLTANPYATKKSSEPGYPYFFTGLEYPSYEASLKLDAFFYVLELNVGGEHTHANLANLYFKFNDSSNPLLQKQGGFTLNSIANEFRLWSQLGNGTMPIIIGSREIIDDYHGEYIKIDDYNHLFEVNMTNVKLTKGTASKYYGTDANRMLVPMTDPDTFWSKSGSFIIPRIANDKLEVTTNTVGSPAIFGGANNYNSYGVAGESVLSYALVGTYKNPANNTIGQGLLLARNGYSSGVNGVGIALDYSIYDASSLLQSGRMINTLTEVTHATAVSSFEWWLVNSGTLGKKMELKGSGQLLLSNYGVGTFTGTPTYVIATNSSGNFIEIPFANFATTTPPVDSGNVISLKTVTLNITESDMIIDGSTFVPPITNKPCMSNATEMIDATNGINHNIITGFTQNGSYYDINITPMPLETAIDVVVSVIHKVV